MNIIKEKVTKFRSIQFNYMMHQDFVDIFAITIIFT